MKNLSILSSIYDFSIIQRFKLFCKLSLVSKLLHYAKNLIVDLLGSIVIGKAFSILDRIFFYPVCCKFFF